MGAIAELAPFEGGGDAFRLACVDHGRGVGRPAVSVEIGRQEPAGLVRQHRIDAGDEVDGR